MQYETNGVVHRAPPSPVKRGRHYRRLVGDLLNKQLDAIPGLIRQTEQVDKRFNSLTTCAVRTRTDHEHLELRQRNEGDMRINKAA